MKRLSLFLLLCALFAFTACEDDDDINIINNSEPNEVKGLNYVEAENGNFTNIYSAITSALTSNPAISIVAEVDHSANATSAGATLRPTRVVMFGNPNLGTPLMQINPQAGLDLPQKMLVYQAEDDDVIIAYNRADYVASRHGVEAASTLPMIRDALGNIAGNAGNDNVVNADDPTVNLNEGVNSVTGPGTVDSVYNRLRGIVENNPNLTVIAELDHQANAASVGMDLPAIRLIVFGNPALGSPLMQDEQSIGIDLPQKMLVYDNEDGSVTIAYNDIRYLADRHDIDDDLSELDAIETALANIAAGALGN